MSNMAIAEFDEILFTSTPMGEMKFRARIFRDLCTVALLTDVDDPENCGVSITNGIEYAVERLSTRWPDISPRVIIEHYPERYDDLGDARGIETFDMVTGHSSKPTWHPMTRAQVEALIGGSLS